MNPFAEPPWYNAINSPYYKDSHRRLRGFIRSYVDEHIIPHCEEWEAQGFIPKEVCFSVKPVVDSRPMSDMRNWDLLPLESSLRPWSTCPTSNSPPTSPQQVSLPSHVYIDGIEWDAFHDLIVIDELARCGYLGVNWGLSCGNAIGCPPIINYGSPAQKRKFLPPILRGEKRMCLAVTEPRGSPSSKLPPRSNF